MKLTGKYNYFNVRNFIHEAMSIRNSSRPITSEITFERFGFSRFSVRGFLNVQKQFKNLKNKLGFAKFILIQFSRQFINEYNFSNQPAILWMYSLRSSFVNETVLISDSLCKRLSILTSERLLVASTPSNLISIRFGLEASFFNWSKKASVSSSDLSLIMASTQKVFYSN